MKKNEFIREDKLEVNFFEKIKYYFLKIQTQRDRAEKLLQEFEELTKE